MLRFLVWLGGGLTAAALAWSGWWVAATSGQEAALAAWLEARAAEGWQAETASIETKGFPTRFERRITGPALADPAAGWAWSAPYLHLDSAAWDPTHVTLAMAPEQNFAVPGQRVGVTAERLGGVAAVVPALSLALRTLALEGRSVMLEAQSGWRTGAERLDLAIERRTEGAPENTYEVAIDAAGILLPGRLGRALEPRVAAGGTAVRGTLRGRARVVTDRPLDRDLVEDGEIGALTVVIREARLDYAGIAFSVDGRLDADDEGRAEGALDIEARDWRRLIDGLVASGTLSSGIADAVRRTVSLITVFSSGDDLSVTLTFSGGAARVGPIPIGDAPRLTTR